MCGHGSQLMSEESVSVRDCTSRYNKSQSGATIVEYAILLAFVAMAVIVTVGVLGQKLDSSFQMMVNLMS